jgi:hypothetical protein
MGILDQIKEIEQKASEQATSLASKFRTLTSSLKNFGSVTQGNIFEKGIEGLDALQSLSDSLMGQGAGSPVQTLLSMAGISTDIKIKSLTDLDVENVSQIISVVEKLTEVTDALDGV